jgi:hypothetical protein
MHHYGCELQFEYSSLGDSLDKYSTMEKELFFIFLPVVPMPFLFGPLLSEVLSSFLATCHHPWAESQPTIQTDIGEILQIEFATEDHSAEISERVN